MDEEIIVTPPAVYVDVIAADGSIIAEQIIEAEAADFLKLRVDPKVAEGCQIVKRE